MRWLLLAGAAWYLYTCGGLPLFSGAVRDTEIRQTLPGGYAVGMPIPHGWRVWRLRDGSQVVIQPGAQTAPGGWVQGTHNGQLVWFNETTGQLGR